MHIMKTLVIGEVYVSYMALLLFTDRKNSWYPLIMTYDIQFTWVAKNGIEKFSAVTL
jgi:hypothetical protein